MRISLPRGTDSVQAHRVEGLNLRVPDIVLQLEQARKDVREARSSALLRIHRRHVVRGHFKTPASKCGGRWGSSYRASVARLQDGRGHGGGGLAAGITRGAGQKHWEASRVPYALGVLTDEVVDGNVHNDISSSAQSGQHPNQTQSPHQPMTHRAQAAHHRRGCRAQRPHLTAPSTDSRF
jgi:hypothetical protein